MKRNTGSSSARRGCDQQDTGSATTEFDHKAHLHQQMKDSLEKLREHIYHKLFVLHWPVVTSKQNLRAQASKLRARSQEKREAIAQGQPQPWSHGIK